MKKYLAVLTAISIFLFVPMYTRASQSSLETTVPSTHTVTIEAEHASVLYVDGDKGLSSAYPVPRFSNPSFQITAEEGYTIKRVFLNGTDVTKEVKKHILKLSEVCENQVIKIETEAISQEPSQEPSQETSREPQPSQEPQTPQTSQDSENIEETVQKQETGKQETGKQLPRTDSSKTENESDGSDAEKEQEASDNTQEVTNTEDPQEQEESGQTTSGDEMPQNLPEKEKRFNLWWSILALPTTGVIAGGIFFIKRRKR